jgi:protein associated with RNAse G/E
LEQSGSLLLLDAVFDISVEHEILGSIAMGTVSLEYYWLDRWYNIFRFSTAGGELLSYYCNINVPPTFDGQTLTYVDLDIDVMVKPDLNYQVLDTEDFERHADLYSYPKEVRRNVEQALKDIIHLIETREFPFDRKL